MTGKNMNGMQTEQDTLGPIPIGDGCIEVVKYLARGPGAHLSDIYNGEAGDLQTVTIVVFCEANWRKIEGRFEGFLRTPAVIDDDLKHTFSRTCGVSVGAYPVDAKPRMMYWMFRRVTRFFHRVEMKRRRIEPEDIDERGEESVRYEMSEVGRTVRVMPAYLGG